MSHLILASNSPRRRELMVEAGYAFEIIVPRPDAEDAPAPGEKPSEYAARMSHQKAADVVRRLLVERTASELADTVVIGCDTVVECAGQILGKPLNASHSRQMLRLLSGQEHYVHSGLCLQRPVQNKVLVKVDRTTLIMDTLTSAQLDEYVASGLWEGKAGSFGYQDRNGWLRIVEGSESNVVGLPLSLLATMLGEWNAAS